MYIRERKRYQNCGLNNYYYHFWAWSLALSFQAAKAKQYIPELFTPHGFLRETLSWLNSEWNFSKQTWFEVLASTPPPYFLQICPLRSLRGLLSGSPVWSRSLTQALKEIQALTLHCFWPVACSYVLRSCPQSPSEMGMSHSARRLVPYFLENRYWRQCPLFVRQVPRREPALGRMVF